MPGPGQGSSKKSMDVKRMSEEPKPESFDLSKRVVEYLEGIEQDLSDLLVDIEDFWRLPPFSPPCCLGKIRSSEEPTFERESKAILLCF